MFFHSNSVNNPLNCQGNGPPSNIFFFNEEVMKTLVEIFNSFVFAASPNAKFKRSFWVCESVSLRDHHQEGSLHLFVSPSQLAHLCVDDMRMAGHIFAMIGQLIFPSHFQPIWVCGDKREVETVQTSKAGVDLTEYLGQKIVDWVGNGTVRHYQRTDENSTRK